MEKSASEVHCFLLFLDRREDLRRHVKFQGRALAIKKPADFRGRILLERLRGFSSSNDGDSRTDFATFEPIQYVK